MNATADNPRPVRKVVVAGGGTAGWLAAAALSSKLGELVDVCLVESDDIGTVGVGEATIPPMRVFHQLLKIDELEFMRATSATYKLGILFENWGAEGERYIHSFGKNGKETWLCDFHHFWLHGLERGVAGELGDYCLELQAAKAGRFATSEQSPINYAYHLDATAYAGFLRRYSEERGVTRIEGRIDSVETAACGIRALTLASGEVVDGDFFIDCTGFRSLLIGDALGSGFEDWGHWLPCDRAVALQTESTGPAVPYTRAIAHDAGWQWQIPLQHRVGNGLVYCSRHLADDAAIERLKKNVSGRPLTEPRVIRFRTGRRRAPWTANCVALGLSSGFVEPLESTSIHLIMMGITRLMQLFPFNGPNASLIDRYNRLTREELEKIRDFIILHYHVNRRRNGDFWHDCRSMDVPPSLAQRIELFKDNAQAYQADGELFRVDSWTQVMVGQGIVPRRHHELARSMDDAALARLLDGIRQSITDVVGRMPTHQQFLDRQFPPQRAG